MDKIKTTTASTDSFKGVTDLLYRIKDDYEFRIHDAYDQGFKTGFEIGLKKGIELAKLDLDNIDPNIDIDMRTIKIFASWCYINGIDFSYMAKATDRESFETRVIRRFINDLKDKGEDKNEINDKE